VIALREGIEATEAHLLNLGFDPSRLIGSKGWTRIQALADAVDALYLSDEAKRRFEILARQVFIRFKALLMEPSAFAFAERHDNIEAIHKKLTERRDTADVTELLKELYRIVNEAIRTQQPVIEEPDDRTYDLSKIDLEKLRDEFSKKVKRKATALQDIMEIVEQKLADMLKRNPLRMDYYKKYQEIVADYNREKDRVTIEETFARVTDLINDLDAEQRRAVQEDLSDEELALFDLFQKENLTKKDRETLKLASQKLLQELTKLITPLEHWTQKEQTRAEVEVFILDNIYKILPEPTFTVKEKKETAKLVYQHIWQQSAGGMFPQSPATGQLRQ